MEMSLATWLEEMMRLMDSNAAALSETNTFMTMSNAGRARLMLAWRGRSLRVDADGTELAACCSAWLG